MGNMNYCKFENTLQDLRDCMDSMNAKDFDAEETDEDVWMLSESETEARKKLIKLCKEIAEDYA